MGSLDIATARDAATAAGRVAAPSVPSPRAEHSRFVQRIRRRYAAELAACCRPGVPGRDGIAALIEQLQRQGRDLGSAMRVARQLMLERLAVLDVEQGAPLADITRAMTELAEATLELALARARADQDARFGVPRNAAGERDRLLGRRHGQARRPRAERLVRHRPDLRLRGRRPRPTAPGR